LKFELKVSKNKTFWNQTLESSLSFIESMLGIISATVTSCLFFSNLKIKDSSNFFLKKLLFHELFFNSKCTKTFSIEVHTKKSNSDNWFRISFLFPLLRLSNFSSSDYCYVVVCVVHLQIDRFLLCYLPPLFVRCSTSSINLKWKAF